MIRPLSEKEARAVIAEARIGRLGCIYNDAPYVVPVNYVFNGTNIYIHSLGGRKIAALRANPRACLQVDVIKDTYNWRSAIAFGQYKEMLDADEQEWAVHSLLLRFPHLTPVESLPVHDGQSSIILFRICVEKITGVGEG